MLRCDSSGSFGSQYIFKGLDFLLCVSFHKQLASFIKGDDKTTHFRMGRGVVGSVAVMKYWYMKGWVMG